jgi:superkiller protein 3
MSSFHTFLLTGLSLVASVSLAQDREWEKAMALDSLGKHEQALKMLDGFLEDPERRYRAQMARSVILFEHLERYEDAFVAVSAAMELEPDSVAPYLNRGSMYLSMQMPDRATVDLEEGLKHCRTGRDSSSVLVNLGSSYTMVRRFDKALAAYDLALASEPDNWAALSNKAAVLDEVDRASEARDIYIKLHELRPDELPILNNLGFLASNEKDYTEAVRWFSLALEKAPNDPIVLNNLGYAQLMGGDTDTALRNIQRSIKLNGANSYAYRNLGLTWKAKGDTDKACTAFEEALSRGFTKQYGPEVEQLRKELCR